MRFADLHLHTHHSDGTRSSREVVDLARRHRLDIIAISDHDNLAAWYEVRDYAAEQGVALIPAAELSAEHRGIDIHVLAYAFDPDNERLTSHLEQFRDARQTRGHRMVQKLIALGYPISSERVEELCAGGAMGRPHIARALVEAGHVESFQEAFTRLIGPGCPAFVPKPRFSIAATVELIRDAGGLTSIAHPTLYPGHEQIVPELFELGIDAVEVFHPDVDETNRKLHERSAARHDKFVTGGSDDHGMAKAKQTIGTVRVPESLIRPILERAGV